MIVTRVPFAVCPILHPGSFSVGPLQNWWKTVQNGQTTYVFTFKRTYKCSRLYFEPFRAILLVTYSIIHPDSTNHQDELLKYRNLEKVPGGSSQGTL